MYKLWKDEEGLTTVEYALLLALVVVAGITAWTTLGGNVSDQVEVVGDRVGGVTPAD
ncbi:MAG: Flp family type IVb pilin [Armatimonadota bacterium]|jgi:Flp pilus assembly pilin Flp